jgi:hypothetical protein
MRGILFVNEIRGQMASEVRASQNVKQIQDTKKLIND